MRMPFDSELHIASLPTVWPRPIGCLIFIGHLPLKSPARSTRAFGYLRIHAQFGLRPTQNSTHLKFHMGVKVEVIRGSFARNDLQLKASYESWPPCT